MQLPHLSRRQIRRLEQANVVGCYEQANCHRPRFLVRTLAVSTEAHGCSPTADAAIGLTASQDDADASSDGRPMVQPNTSTAIVREPTRRAKRAVEPTALPSPNWARGAGNA
jgi:hypothetical protein